MSLRLSLALVAVFTFAGCKHQFPLPYTLEQLNEDSARWPGDALVHYLTQDNADVAVCGSGPLQRLDEQLAEPFVEALREDTLAPQRWGACGKLLVPAIPPATREFLLGRLAKVVLALLEDPKGAERLIAVNEVLDARPREPSASLDVLMKRMNEVNPASPPVFYALMTTLELDHGQYGGQPLTTELINTAQDDLVLTRMASRVPSASLREDAKRRLVRLRIERSDWPEVKARADEVEKALMATGRWAQPVKSLALERPELPMPLPFNVKIRQNTYKQVAALVAPGPEHDEVMPAFDLKPHLRFAVKYSKPLALCEAAEAMRVEPCIDAREVEFAGAMRVDGEGVARLPDSMPMQQVFELARSGEGLLVAVRLSGKLVTSLSVPVQFLEPSASYFSGSTGQVGPAVNVMATSAGDYLLLEGVSQSAERRFVVVPKMTSRAFEFGSRGGDGQNGTDGYRGSDGSRGVSGSSATCPSSPATSGGSGGNGSSGGNGTDGGPAGDGGPVQVELRCPGPCPQQDTELVRRIIVSRGGTGGRGGDGGRGGRGGDGGRGGSGTTCTTGSGTSAVTTTLPSASDGYRGNDGSNGWDGSNGRNGNDGPVTYR
ncbi:MAG: hypothetical protein QM817_31295 [Archangium sp.]